MTHEDQQILIYAMRYALGMHGKVVIDVTNKIIANWKDLEAYHQKIIKGEIKLNFDAIEREEEKMKVKYKKEVDLMATSDRTNWEKILDLKQEQENIETVKPKKTAKD